MGESTGPAAMALGALPSLAAAGSLLWAVACRRTEVRRRLGRLARPTAVCAALSLITSFAPLRAGSGWKLVEVALLSLLVAVVTRWSRGGPARVGPPAGHPRGDSLAAAAGHR
ncbi:hypothetical protein [Streptomyces sp. YPW6]|uniref:hypothetical protein n=1 Tax=Streptomyces sp. YPW6 TaxID=2840373 RepID=UPI003EBFC816